MTTATATGPGAREFGLTFDETAWPLLYVRFPSRPLNDEGVERRIRFVSIVDSRGLTTAITAHQRKRLTEWFDVTGDLAQEHHFGIAVLINNAIIRGALKAVTWMKPIPVPVKPFSSIADSGPWIREIFSEQRIPITPSMEALLAGRG